MKLKAFTLSLASLASLSLLVACSQRVQQFQQPAAQPQTQQTQQSQSAASSSTENTNQAATSSSQNAPEAQPTNIDGTYTGQGEGDRITLVVTGTTGTWTQVETDGKQEIKQISFDAANQQMIIGDDVKIYAINDNQMIIDDMDREASDRIVLSKQTRRRLVFSVSFMITQKNNHKYLPSVEYLSYTSINYLFLAFKLSRRGYEIQKISIIDVQVWLQSFDYAT